jgi:formylglycine-generating enzyme required for sulfatase activity
LGGAAKLAELLAGDVYAEAKKLLRQMSQAEKRELRQAFDQAWAAASAGAYSEALGGLFNHRPFQEAVAAGLLDPLEGFDVQAVKEEWANKFPGDERELKRFFRSLEKLLLRDPLWKPLLEPLREAAENGDLHKALAQQAPGLSIGQFIAQQTVFQQVVEPGGVAIGGQARVQICQNYYLAPSGNAALSGAEFDKCLKEYLDWVAQANDQARLFGVESMGSAKGRPNKLLQDVFLPVSLRYFAPLSRRELEEIEAQAELHEKKRVYLKKIKQKQAAGALVELPDLLVSSSRLAVIGGPGCGKSTLLAYLSLALARQVETGTCFFKLPKAPLVPVLIPLRYYRQYKELCAQKADPDPDKACWGTLRGFIPWYINRYSTRNFPGDFFDRLLRGGGCVLMLDGLDEVVDQAERGQVRAEVERLVCEQYPKNQVIVTAREAGYQKDAVFGEDFLRLDVQPLADKQIAVLVENWCRQLYPLEVEERKQELLQAAAEINRRTERAQQAGLVRSPLMTSMVISVKYYEAELPRERARLYEAVVRVILQAQYLREDITREALITQVGDWDEQREWLSELALEMQAGGEKGAVISEGRLREILGRSLTAEQVERFVVYIRQRGGLFEERAEMFQFAHLSFQEFLAARRLAKMREKAYPVLAEHLLDSWWRETLMLVYGFGKMDYPEAAKAYLDWLQTQNGADEGRLAGLELAGAALLEVEKAQPAAVEKMAQTLSAVLFDPARQSSPRTRWRAGDTLARLGDPRFDPDWYFLPREPLLGFIKIPAGAFVMGSDPQVDKDTRDDEKPQHTLFLPDYYLGKYPVTTAQFGVFVKSSGYTPQNEDCLRELPNHPVRWVTWYEACAYCEWLDRMLHGREDLPGLLKDVLSQGGRVSLPSEAEWEKAARGVDGRLYPWGNDYDPKKANVEMQIGEPSCVGSFPAGGSLYGCADLAGNVWEWTRSLFKIYPYVSFDGREDLTLKGSRVLRGGSFIDHNRGIHCTSRSCDNPGEGDFSLGFRVSVVSPVLTSEL